METENVSQKSPIEEEISKLNKISLIPASQNIGNSMDTINNNYRTLYNISTAMEETYVDYIQPILDFYQKNKKLLENSNQFIKVNNKEWQDFYTMVQQNSSVWILPMTVFYPTLIIEPLTDEKITKVGNWLKENYPVRKIQDNTLNYVENQKFIVTCYLYNYTNERKVLDQPSSYCLCSTQSGLISLHCQTIISGGWIHCHQGKYNCGLTLNCYPKLNVNCWYESPYLKTDGSPIKPSDPVESKQTTISKIQADIKIDYIDRRETDIKNLVFIVENCDWVFIGEQ
jgi:hypothetical protein